MRPIICPVASFHGTQTFITFLLSLRTLHVDQTYNTLLGVPRVGAFLGNVAVLTAIVASFVSSCLSAVGRDVPHLAAIEAAPVLRTRLVDDLTGIAFKPGVGAISSDMTSLLPRFR
jgi:hypothetical protein